LEISDESPTKLVQSAHKLNYGQRLYQKGIKKKEEKKKLFREVRKENAEKEIKEATFTPVILTKMEVKSAKPNKTKQTLGKTQFPKTRRPPSQLRTSSTREKRKTTHSNANERHKTLQFPSPNQQKVNPPSNPSSFRSEKLVQDRSKLIESELEK
jgi:hypothetical protein